MTNGRISSQRSVSLVPADYLFGLSSRIHPIACRAGLRPVYHRWFGADPTRSSLRAIRSKIATYGIDAGGKRNFWAELALPQNGLPHHDSWRLPTKGRRRLVCIRPLWLITKTSAASAGLLLLQHYQSDWYGRRPNMASPMAKQVK